MLSEELLNYLVSETVFSDLEDEAKVIRNEVLGEEIGKAINGGDEAMLEFSCELSEKLLDMDVYKASVITNFIGFVCEKTQNTRAAEGVIKLLAKSSVLVKEFWECFKNEQGEIIMEADWNGAEIYSQNKDATCAYYGFNTLCVSAMAFLAREYKCREFMKSLDVREVVSYLAEEVPEIEYMRSVFYVNRIYDTCGRIPLVVLDEERGQGVIVEANDLNNCFHLIFLLEEALYNNFKEKYGMEGYVPDEVLSELAGGKYPDCGDRHAQAFFTEYCYPVRNDVPNNQDIHKIYDLLWSEMSPMYIPALDGYGVIILKRSGPHRGFSSSFLFTDHTALSPYVKIVRELSDAEYKEWEKKLNTLRIEREK